MRWSAAFFSAACFVVVAPAAVHAGGGADTDPYEDVSDGRRLWIGGIADLYAMHNFNSPASGTNQLRQFDIHSDLPSINFVRLTLAHKPRRIGFRIDAGFGNTADVYFAEDPASVRHPDVARAFSYLEQAFVTVVLPFGHRIAIDVGKFNTPVGLEDNETPTNWNYSRSLIFTFAEPTLHTGTRVTFEPAPTLGVSIYWINGWNSNFIDGSDMRSFAAAATWKPRAGIEVAFVYIGGMERAPTMLGDPTLHFRNVVDGYVVYSPARWLSLATSADYGNDRAHGGVSFWGVAAFAQARPLSWLACAARGEYFSDPDGFTTGTRQNVGEVTATVDVHGHVERAALAARLEYRHDTSSAPVFERTVQPMSVSTQDTLLLALVAGF